MSEILADDIASIFQGKQSIHLNGTHDVYELEQRISKYYGKKHCLLFCNATTALLSIAIALEIKKSHIIAPPLSWGGTISPFLLLNNQVSFSDVDEVLCLKPDTLEGLIYKDTKALISVDFGGASADSRKIKSFCEENGIFYISDSSQSFGAFRDKRPAGTFSDVIVTSFTYGKTLFGGEGGAVITDDEELYEKLIFISQHPNRQKKVFGLSNYNVFAPLNGRVHPFTAFFINQKFDDLLCDLVKRQQAYFRLTEELIASKVTHQFKHTRTFDYSTYFDFYAPVRDGFQTINHSESKNVFVSTVDDSSCLYQKIKGSAFAKMLRDQPDVRFTDFLAGYRKFKLNSLLESVSDSFLQKH